MLPKAALAPVLLMLLLAASVGKTNALDNGYRVPPMGWCA